MAATVGESRVNRRGLLSWPTDMAAICERVRSHKSPFKVLMKTRNEEILLRPWLEHYAKFMSPSEIIIADNMSTSERVLDVYRNCDEEVTIFQYETTKAGWHNYIHNRANFGPLYKAIEDSCDHFIFVDNDEFLILSDGKSWSLQREHLFGALQPHKGKALPSVWLEPIPKSLDICVIGDDESKLVQGIAWGKPVQPSSYSESGILIHNAQFPRELFDYSEQMFILLHLVHYSPEQRLSVNRQKLATRGFVSAEDSYQDIAARDTSEATDLTVVRLVEEVRAILLRDPGGIEIQLDQGRLRLAESGAIEFGSVEVEDIFTGMFNKQPEYLDHAYEVAEEILSHNKPGTSPTVVIEGEVMDEQALREMASSQPNKLDQYGDPVFLKELIRMLLAQGRWEDAKAVVPQVGGPGLDGWYHILFAREYDTRGEFDKSIEHWQLFAATRPSHREAIEAIRDHEVKELEPRMTEAERDLFQKTIAGASCLLEFGAGGSTSLAAMSGVENIISVESDLKWLKRLAHRPEIKQVNFTPFHVDIGRTGGWGFPVDREREADWSLYYTKVWGKINPDVVLINGRFRVACALMSVVHCSSNTKILVHDFWDRENYKTVLKYVECIGLADTLAVFVKKQEIEWRDLVKDIARYAHDAR